MVIVMFLFVTFLAVNLKQRVNVSEDSITCCALRSFRMANMNTSLRIRWVARKYREADRTIIITRSFLEPLHLPVPAKVGFRETQVFTISPSESTARQDDSEANTTLSRIDTHASVTADGPDDGSGNGMRAWIASSDGEAALSVWRHAFQMRKTAIEDQLFQESRSR